MAPANPQKHILVLNDSEEVLALMKELLEDEGYRVTVQAYAAKAIGDVVAVGPDLVILDYMWASADTGWSMLQMLKMSPKTRNIPVVVCTGAVAQVEDLSSRLAEMQVRVVLKPFDLEELLDAIDASFVAQST